MSSTLDSITAQALALPPDERYELAQRLWVSVERQIDDDEELFAEIARRDAEMEAGNVATYSHEEILRDIRRALGE